jgi:hypothetical protein
VSPHRRCCFSSQANACGPPSDAPAIVEDQQRPSVVAGVRRGSSAMPETGSHLHWAECRELLWAEQVLGETLRELQAAGSYRRRTGQSRAR